jgi:hypothetical protein
MSDDDNKRAVAEFVERCQNQHDLAFADRAIPGRETVREPLRKPAPAGRVLVPAG